MKYFGGPCCGEDVPVDMRECPYLFVETKETTMNVYRNDLTRFVFNPSVPSPRPSWRCVNDD